MSRPQGTESRPCGVADTQGGNLPLRNFKFGNSMSPELAHKNSIVRRSFQWGWMVFTLAILALPTMILFVDETEFVIVERLGRISAVYDQPSLTGLHVKLPWPIESVRRFDRRLRMMTPAGREAFTRDRKNVTVEAYVCWKIAAGDNAPIAHRPVVKFFQGLGDVDLAEARIGTRLQSILTEQLGRSELSELLSVTDSEAGPVDHTSALNDISGRIRVEMQQREDEQQSIKERLGVEIVDVRIRRLNLPVGNMQAVYERMRSERQKIAEQYRSAGLAENRMIRSQADRQAGELLAQARADAERIRGEGEAAAIQILNRAHVKDPEFAEHLQTLDAYRQIMNDRTTLILSGSTRFLNLFMNGAISTQTSDGSRQTSEDAIKPAESQDTVAPER